MIRPLNISAAGFTTLAIGFMLRLEPHEADMLVAAIRHLTARGRTIGRSGLTMARATIAAIGPVRLCSLMDTETMKRGMFRLPPAPYLAAS